MKLLAQLQPGTFQSAWVVSPIGPARGNRQNDWMQEGEVAEVLENLGVFVVLDAVPNGLQTNPGSGLRGSDRARRIEEDAVARSAHAAAASGGVHVVPTADGVSGGPSVGAIVKNSRWRLRPVHEPGLDAL